MPEIVVNPVTRIEGHAKITLDLDEAGQLRSGHMQVLEIRGFEKLLQGMELYKMPQMTARLCGVCPAAHHLVAVTAIENGLGVTPPPAARRLRDLLYAGHIIHSHALSNFVLTGPDLLLGIDAEPASRNVFSLLRVAPELAKKLLRVRSIGQRVVEMVGGRGVHPVAAVPGGMSGAPTPDQLTTIASWGGEAVTLLEEVVEVLSEKLGALGALREPLTLPFRSLALSNDGRVSYLDGVWVVQGPDGAEERHFAGSDYAQHLVEHVMPGSYMKSVRLRGPEEQHFFVGPLARLNVNQALGTPRADAALTEYRAAGTPRTSAIDYVQARLIEMLHCAERLAELAGSEIDGPLRVPVEPAGAGRFVGAIEAPRGFLVHDFTTDDDGRLTAVNLIVATQNNYDAIDHAITGLARHLLPQGDDGALLNGIEFAMRCFDPCLACATHVAGRMPLEVGLTCDGRVERTIRRRAAS